MVNNITIGLLSVPLFKALTGLPPYLGMLAALGTMWSLTDAIHAGEGDSREVTDWYPHAQAHTLELNPLLQQ